MTPGWRTLPLGDRTVNLDRKRKPVTKKHRTPGPYPYYGASGVVDYVDDHIFEGLHLLVAEDGENLRSRKSRVAFLADGKFWVNNHAHILQANGENDLRFLAYAVERTDISGYVTGSAQPKLSQAALRDLPIVAPRLHEQRGIAATLGALDDKIDSNRRAHGVIWDLLEAQHTSLELEGTVDTLGSVLALRYGKSLPATRRRGGPVPVYGSNGVTGFHDDALIEGPAVIVGRKGSVGEVHWSHDPCFPIDTTFYVEPFGAYPLISTYFLLRAAGLTGKNTDSAIPGLNRENALSTEVSVPDPVTVASWKERVSPLLRSTQQLLAENQKLASLRDALLPELLSGRIRVPEAAAAVASA